MRALITGVNGFVGRAVFMQLVTKNEMQVTGSLRKSSAPTNTKSTIVEIGDISSLTNWSEALVDVDVVVHTAARVHVMNEVVADPLSEFRSVNVQGTLNLARQAVLAGVKRFIFISSVKVNGESTKNNLPFLPEDAAAPVDPYGISKMEAEQGLFEVAAQTGLEVVVIRPPLVYGSGAKANFAALMRAVQRKWVLPLGAIHNKRSLVALDNLVDLITTCINHPQAAGQVFLVSDGHDLSTTELVHGLAKATGVSARLIPIPAWVLRNAAAMVGKGDAVNRLCGNLQVDISKSRQLLGWTPPISVDEGLLRAVKGMQQ
jgi:nucleoside-diphosphate-sugar epimerase